MTSRTAEPTAPYFDVADPGFSVTSAEVRRAREAGWLRADQLRLAVLRYDQVSPLIRHPALRRQPVVACPPRHHLRALRGLVGPAGSQPGGEAHQRMRRLLSPAFSRRNVEALRPASPTWPGS